jgi:PQQ system protein
MATTAANTVVTTTTTITASVDVRARLPILALSAAALALSACNYVRLLRPSVLKQLNPRMVALVNELPKLDRQNEEIIGRLFAQGGLAHAKVGADGVMRARIRVFENKLIWQPGLIVMPSIGELELEFSNEDRFFHLPYLPSVGDYVIVELPARTAGRARIRLDQPGLYMFSDAIANFAGRGMTGAVLVRGEVPAQAKMERPAQRRP